MFLYVVICFSEHVKYFISFFFFGLAKLDSSSRMFKFAMAKNMSNFLIYLDFLVVVIYIYYSKKKNKINPSTLVFTLKQVYSITNLIW